MNATQTSPAKKICSFEGCQKKRLAKNLCSGHYQQHKAGKQLTELKFTGNRKITDMDRFLANTQKTNGCWIWTGTKNRKGYGQIWAKGKNVLAHRFAYQMFIASLGEGTVIDHTCRNTSCVNPNHLREASNKQNLENRNGPSKANKSSGVRGVTWYARDRKWKGQVGHNGKHYHTGYFATIEEAEKSVIAKRNELFTHNDLDRN